jgi:ketosteroid isomerase-like protein
MAMSRQNVATYRVVPVKGRRFKRRRLGERLLVRFPRLASAVRSVVFHLPVGSRLRRAILSTACRNGFDALRRGEYEAMAAICHPEVETIYMTAPGETVGDLETEYRTREGLIQSLRSWSEAWSDWALEPNEMLDFGDRLLVRGRFVGRGMLSGVTTEQAGAIMFTLHRGWITSQHVYLGTDLPLEAAELARQHLPSKAEA